LQHELDEGAPRNFDVLAIDAFSGDAIPVHLLTKEAVALYMKHLKPDGVLALHISNRHLRLLPVVKAISDSLGLAWLLVDTSYPDEDVVPWDSTWVLVARDQKSLAPYGPGDEPGPVMTVAPFTDEFSIIMKLLKFQEGLSQAPPSRRPLLIFRLNTDCSGWFSCDHVVAAAGRRR
jgi:hypothetical protein